MAEIPEDDRSRTKLSCGPVIVDYARQFFSAFDRMEEPWYIRVFNRKHWFYPYAHND
jgi:hypothetical protein